VGPLEKALAVLGPRRWRAGVPTEPEPIAELRLGWDKAFGGPGLADNPQGIGFAPVEIDGERVHPLPQIELQGALVRAPSDRPTPAGFGPLAPTLPIRQKGMGTYDKRWLTEEFPGYAHDVDPECFMVAPPDQRLTDYFAGHEPIELRGLHPRSAVLETRVTALVARCFLLRGEQSRRLEEVPTRLDTIVLLPNVERMVAIFRGVATVAESDASDVTCLLAALERRGEERPIGYYEVVLGDRLDHPKRHLYALRDADLLPERDESAPAPKLDDDRLGDMDELLRREGILEKRSRGRAQRELDGARRTALVLGVDPDERGIPRELPPAKAAPSFDELPEYVEAVEAQAAKLEAEAKEAEQRALTDARTRLAELGVDLDEVLERSKQTGGGPPRFRADEHLARMRETADAARALGAPIESLEAQLTDAAFVEKLRRLEREQIAAYRRVAHHMTAATTPPEAERAAQRARVVAALDSGEPMNGWDLTGADLHALDFSSAELREALLECSNLRGCHFTSTDLRGAVLTRADLTDAELRSAQLEQANLGEAEATGADFTGAKLRGATLDRARLEKATLARALLRGASLLEARLAGADLTDADAEEALFYECDLAGVTLDRARLRKATFFRCRLGGASFRRAVLEGAALVEAKAAEACFEQADARNLRLVLGCDLTKSRWRGARLTLATLRGATFSDADLSEVCADGCDLSESDLRRAQLCQASLRGARLMRSDLGGAVLDDANLIEALLLGAKLEGASFRGAVLFRANLLGAVGDADTRFTDAHVARALVTRREP
jgi:uncharacterized protein YjbI with pentapeptide repeats